MSTYILVHGAWHGAWCWNKLAPLLEQAGHNVITPDLPGHGDDTTPLKNISTEMYVNKLCDKILIQNEPVILVGHSMAGMVISQVAEIIPDRITTLVYLSGFLLVNGQSIRDIQSQVSDSLVSPNLILSPDKLAISIPANLVREAFYHDCTDTDFDYAIARTGLQPVMPFITPVKLTKQKSGSVTRVYIECTLDRALPLTAQKTMHETSRCKSVYSLQSGHSAFFSRHRELGEILLAL